MATKERNALNKPGPGKTRTASAPEPDEVHGTDLDRYDVAILDELQRDARLSNAELASRIGLSAAPTWRRVKWLEAQGYITGYRAEIDRRRIGLGVLAFVRVDAERNNASAIEALEQAIRARPEVVACHYISGAGTFELHVVATDLDAYSRWSMDTLFKLPNVKDIHTSFSLGEVKAGAALPLKHLKAMLAACLVGALASGMAPELRAASNTPAAPAALPARQLLVELRQVPLPAAPVLGTATRTAPGAGAGAALPPGSVVVGTGGRIDAGPSVTLRSGSAAAEAPPLLQVQVANGERAWLRVQRSEAGEPEVEAVWASLPTATTGRAPTAAASAAQPRAGVMLRQPQRLSWRQIEVWPRWPGGAQPVQLRVSAAQAGADSETKLETSLAVPLDRWTPLARSTEPAAPQEWQLRITLRPE